MKRYSFTLVELLAVIVIAGFMLGLAVPAFRSLTTGHALDRAAREIMGRIRATRAYAASKRVDTALIFATNETNIPNSMQYSSYRSCEVYYDGSNWQFSQWIKGDSWTPIPEGIMVGVPQGITTGSNRLFLKPNSVPATGTTVTTANLALETTPSSTVAALTVKACLVDDLPNVAADTKIDLTNAIVFRSTGLVVEPCLIELREAIHDDSGIRAVASDSASVYYPLVVRKNGKCVYYPEKKNY